MLGDHLVPPIGKFARMNANYQKQVASARHIVNERPDPLDLVYERRFPNGSIQSSDALGGENLIETAHRSQEEFLFRRHLEAGSNIHNAGVCRGVAEDAFTLEKVKIMICYFGKISGFTRNVRKSWPTFHDVLVK